MKKIIFIITVAVMLMPVPASAVGSRLTQTITPIDCTNTNTDNGITINESIDCDGVTSPTVVSRTYARSSFYLSGTMGGMQWRTLRVLFLGHWYTYGEDTELTVVGDMWQLAVSGSPAGTHSVTVEIITINNQLVRSQGTVTVELTDTSAGQPASEGDTGQQGGGRLVDTGDDVWLYALAAGSVVILGGVLVLLARYHR